MSSKLKILHSKITSDKGKELLILHGFLGMGDNWKTYANVLTKIGYRVHLIDQRNHGKSFWSEEFSYSVMAEDILNYCKFHNLGQIFILGHSMGGKVAMEFAFNHSYLLKAFIIADISPRKYEPKHEQILNGLSCLDFNKINSRAAANEKLSIIIPENSLRQFLLKNLYWVEKGRLGLRVNIEVLKKASHLIGKELNYNVHSKLPCLFLKGENSDYILDSDEDIIRDYFPKAKIATISKAGHWLHAENPKEFIEVTSKWLNKFG